MKSTHLLVIVLLLVTSCDLINPEEQVPGYVYVEPFTYVSQPGEGSEEVEIVDAWLFVDNDALGVYQLPGTIPILSEGKTLISIAPGIMLHRIKETRTNNPFYKTVHYDLNLAPGKIDTIRPITGLTSFAKLRWLEDFESPGHKLDSSNFSRSNFIRISDPAKVFEGNESIGFRLDQTNFKFFGQSSKSDPFDPPDPGKPVFLELHYKNTNTFSVDLKIQRASGAIQDFPHLSLKASSDWKKVYINFTPFTSSLEDGAQFWVVFQSTLDDGRTEGEVLIDNIKLMY